MTNDKGIFIKNVFCMLSYAFQTLKQSNFERIASEHFDNAEDLLAAILSASTAQQLKQGLYREYSSVEEILPSLRGKLDINRTIKLKMNRQAYLACKHDELSENNVLNQIVKTALHFLSRSTEVKKERKNAIKKLLLFFENISLLNPANINWQRIVYGRHNKNYELLINISYFVLDGLLPTTKQGHYKMNLFSDAHMARLYEKFILEYYRKHYPQYSAKATKIKWDLSEKCPESSLKYLPTMQTDITLQFQDRILIIDAKYYGHTLQKSLYGKATLHSHNIYQIFTYVKNYDTNNTGKVAGLLLYAKTNERITPDCSFIVSGNKIAAKTLDLNQDFSLITAQLNDIAAQYLCIKT